MGYFSNNTEGDDYEARWCRHCIHYSEEKPCSVMVLHELYNYQKRFSDALEILIPTKGIENLECSMRIEEPGAWLEGVK